MEELEVNDLEHEKRRKKRFLCRYKKNCALIDRLENKLAELDERICKVKSPNYSGMPKGGMSATLEDLISDKIETEERINSLATKGKKLKTEILAKIDELDDTRYADVLEMFFIERKDFDTIALECGYTRRHVIRLYTNAIVQMSL